MSTTYFVVDKTKNGIKLFQPMKINKAQRKILNTKCHSMGVNCILNPVQCIFGIFSEYTILSNFCVFLQNQNKNIFKLSSF